MLLNEQQKHDALIEMMEVLEKIDSQLAMASAIEHIPAEYATTALWESIREMMPDNRALMEMLKQSVQFGTKIIDDDACLSHLTAVVEAP